MRMRMNNAHDITQIKRKNKTGSEFQFSSYDQMTRTKGQKHGGERFHMQDHSDDNINSDKNMN